jgi:K+/H+ antiporter YhaU regulatory subunit KhtT
MINHRDKLNIIVKELTAYKLIIKKTTERAEINVRTTNDEKLIAKVDYETLRAVIITKDDELIQFFIECLERIEVKFRKELIHCKELPNHNIHLEFTVV